MLGPYMQLLVEDLYYENVKSTLQHLLDNNIYERKALRAYIILDDTFGKTTDRRKLKWAKRYLQNHNIKFQDIQKHIDATWKEDIKFHNQLLKAFAEKYPSAWQFMERYL